MGMRWRKKYVIGARTSISSICRRSFASIRSPFGNPRTCWTQRILETPVGQNRLSPVPSFFSNPLQALVLGKACEKNNMYEKRELSIIFPENNKAILFHSFGTYKSVSPPGVLSQLFFDRIGAYCSNRFEVNIICTWNSNNEFMKKRQ